MEYRSSFDRINNISDIAYISKNVCKDYSLGKYTNYEIIDIGYEDFNYILHTEKGRYVVKIFNTDRDNISCERLIKILITSINNGINTPKLYKTSHNSYIYTIKIENVLLKLFVMEYIEGQNLYLKGRDLEDKELKEIAKISSKINSIDYAIKETFYDEWTVTNLREEYEKKKKYLTDEDYKKVTKILLEFEKIDFKLLKYAYIHGDIIKANLILDKNKKLYVIDFSAFNYLPRIIEVAVILLGDCLTSDKDITLRKMSYFLKEYNKCNIIEEKEKECLPILLNALASMYIIQTSYIKETMGDYLENEYWLAEGKKALSMKISKQDLVF